MNNLQLKIILSMADKLTAPLRNAMKGSKELAAALGKTKDEVKQLEKAQKYMERFSNMRLQGGQLNKSVDELNNKITDRVQKLKSLNATNQDLRAKIKATELDMAQWKFQVKMAKNPEEFIQFSKSAENAKNRLEALLRDYEKASAQTKKYGAETRKAKRELADIAEKKKNLAEQLRLTKTLLRENGINTRQLASEETRLATGIKTTNERLEEQRKRMERLNEAQKRLSTAKASYQKTKDLQGKLAGTGAGMIATGATMSSPIIAAVKQYADFEDAMKGVAKQVNGARDGNGKLTSTYYDMAKAIKAISERLPSENGAIDIAALVEGAARMGIQGTNNLLSFAEASAKASKAFELPAGDLAENMGKIANLYKIPISNIEQLGDVINYLDDNAQSKGSDIIDVLQRMGGVADKLDYKKAAALGSTFLSLGAQSDVAATASIAMVRELSIATMQGKRFQAGMKTLGLSSWQMEKSMSKDSMGSIITVLEKIKKLPKEAQMRVTTQLFGKEYGKDAAKLANNLDELHKQLKLVNDEKAKGSMQRESDIDADSLSAQWTLLRSGIANTFSSLGSTLRSPLMDILGRIKQITIATRQWVEEHPRLSGFMLKTLAVISAVTAAVGGLSLAVAAILGPLALNKLIFSTLGINVLPILWKALKYGGGVFLWLGRVAAANPLGLLVTALAGAALLIWQNWDWIKGKFGEFFQWIDEKVQGMKKMLKEAYDMLPDSFKTTVEVPKNFQPGAAMPWQTPAVAGFGGLITPTTPITAGKSTVIHAPVHAPITIIAQPGQDHKAIAQEVQKQLDAAQRKQKSQSRSRLSDRD